MQIRVQDLVKTYQVPLKDPGLRGSLRALWARKYREIQAVKGISFTIEPGERVGFLGPNGAGKTTTLKVLTGLLHPTSGIAQIGPYIPRERHPDLLRAVTLVMGQ